MLSKAAQAARTQRPQERDSAPFCPTSLGAPVLPWQNNKLTPGGGGGDVDVTGLPSVAFVHSEDVLDGNRTV